jgi:hypothetical protein
MMRAVPDPQGDVCAVDAIDRSVVALRMGDRPLPWVGRGWTMVHRGTHPHEGHHFLALGFWEPGLLKADPQAVPVSVGNLSVRNLSDVGRHPEDARISVHPEDARISVHPEDARISVHPEAASGGRDRCLRGCGGGFPCSPRRG